MTEKKFFLAFPAFLLLGIGFFWGKAIGVDEGRHITTIAAQQCFSDLAQFEGFRDCRRIMARICPREHPNCKERHAIICMANLR